MMGEKMVYITFAILSATFKIKNYFKNICAIDRKGYKTMEGLSYVFQIP